MCDLLGLGVTDTSLLRSLMVRITRCNVFEFENSSIA